MNNTLRKVIFVGSFVPAAADGTVGGQMFACRSLLESPLSDYVDWHLIDTTQRSLPPPNLVVRVSLAAVRILKLLFALMFQSADALLIFSSYRPSSLAEKGLMCLLGKLWGKQVVMSFRSEIKPQSSDRWALWFKRLVVRNCDQIICQSDAAAHALVDLLGASQEQITIIPNWIDGQLYRRPKDEKQVVGQPLQFVYVGWLEVFKGVGELLDAAHTLQANGLDFRLVLCGNGSQSEVLKAKALNLDSRIEFRGWVDKQELIKILHESDVFVLPSYSEGLPNSLLEAMAAGLAVITTPVGGIPSVVVHEQNGLLVMPKDPAALAQAMSQMAANPAGVREMGYKNVEKVAREHDIHVVWPRVAQVLSVRV